MKFTILISTYNRLHLLKRAIYSALNQTIDCEVVVVDDCSSDDTGVFIKSLGNSIVYHRNPVNQGHAASVNAGIAKANGEWIKFLDDDDYLAPNCLEEIEKAISIHPHAVICSCIAAQVDSKEVELSRTRPYGSNSACYIPQADIHYGMLLELVPFGTPAQVACRRDAFMKTHGWDSTLNTNCDDIDSWIHIAQFGDAIFLNQCLAYRTIWTGAYNQKISLSQRLATNILMKQKIYTLVDEQHRSKIPDFQDIQKYLKLHWILVAIKQRNFRNLLPLLDLSILSFQAWRILLSVMFMRHFKFKNDSIRQIPLM
ncbi:glycosyltransferase family 2 protein [Anabaena cylindrica UHCC 0172]|uniref:glycosyltransferase family 2 protein n=1 Tax=Anabaena cylindrica TaxID=1165 RepID=UPI002B1E977E|nr:glycosyltransferase family 2 protein [Anabaena cylindrica]MEA5553561.1 glycosyltransferase family 2 protein [Anabaena cylindrica UHCC 0172]